VADFASQAVVAQGLEQAFPNDPLVAEEDAAALRNSPGELEQVQRFVTRSIPGAQAEAVCAWIDRGMATPRRRFWTLDPIDGTKGFLRGDQYAVALALLVDGQVQVAALGCPVLSEARRPDLYGAGCLVLAVRGQGAWTTPLADPGPFERLQVSDIQQPERARLLRSYEAGHTNVGQIDELTQALGSRAEPVRMDSQAKYAVLASGGGELLVRLLSPAKPDYREKIWDQAAGALVLEEAGGMITDLSGAPLDFNAGRTLARNRGVLASNGRLHAAALRALRSIGA
jgi:3'(2'), 5'-bisphosphate nucleotidase